MTRQHMTADEYGDYLGEGVTPPDAFRPSAFYNPDGDCIEFFASNEPFKAKRIDNLVTVYIGRDSNEVVGSLIKGVSEIFHRILKQVPGFKIEIRGGRIKMELLFAVCLWSSERDPEGTEVVVYDKLRKAAEHADIEADTRELCLV